MGSASERDNNTKTVLSLALAVLAVLWLGGSFATADPSFGQSFSSPQRTALGSPPRLKARFASHHEEEEEDEHEGDEEEDLEIELMQLEVERAALEAYFGGLELIEKIGELASDDDRAAVFALTMVTDEYDLPESKLMEFLQEVVSKSPSKAAKLVASMKIAEIHNERGDSDAALNEARRILLGGR